MPADHTPSSHLSGGGPVLLATDGDPSTDDAARLAGLLSARNATRLRVVSADGAGAPSAIGREGAWRRSEDLDQDDPASLYATVRERFTSALGSDGWDLSVREGKPAEVIAAVAREIGAALVVMGRSQSRTVRHMLGEALALQVVRLSEAPVLAVCPGAGDSLPNIALVAVDFSAASVTAARAALWLLAPAAGQTAQLVLLHVRSRSGHEPGESSDQTIDQRTNLQFDQLEALLRRSTASDVEIHRCERTGDVSACIQSVTEERGVQVVAMGTHGRGLLERLFVGSAAITTLRESDVSVLIAPAPALAERVRLELELWEHVTLNRPEDWGEALRVFSERNAGRVARLAMMESLSGETVVQVQAQPFLEARWDNENRRIDLVFGAADAAGSHRVQELLRVIAIELIGDHGGPTDHALLFEDASGHGALTFAQAPER